LNHLPFNPVDIAVIGVLIISGLMAFSRGLVREVLSIGAWVGAAVVTVYAFPHLRPFTRVYIKSDLLADIATGVGICIVTLFVCTAISHMLSRNVRGSGFGALDRSLGFFFGLARGAVLVCLAYLFFTWAVPKPEDQPDVIKQAQSLRVIAPGADLIRSLLPKDALSKGSQAADAAKNAVEQQLGQQALDSMSQPAPKSPAAKPDPGYNENERKDLNKLIQSTQ
jgi:membrane protein required for colicin V production